MNKLLTALAKSSNRVALANNCNLPINYNTGSNWVQNCWTTHKSGPAGYTSVEVLFVNGLISANSEQNAYYDFYLRAGLYLNGQFYRFLFDGQTETLVSKNWGIARGKLGIYIPPNTTFIITNRRVASDAGAAGSYNVITNTSGTLVRQDGILSGTDNTKDFTLGVGCAYGAKCLHPPTISGGAITAVSVDTQNRGTGYTNGTTLNMWYGPAGAGQPGALMPGSGVTGFGNRTGDYMSSVTVSTGGTGHNSANPPKAFLGGGINGFGSATTASYGPSLITGIPRARTPSVLLHGDSLVAGYGSTDGTGDLAANHGFFEQALTNRYGVHKIAVGGTGANGWMATNTQQMAFINYAISKGLRPSHVILALGTNDFIANTNTNVLSTVQGYIAQITAIWRARGAKVLVATIPPCNTTSSGSNKFTTLAEQSPYNVNYESGSYVDQYNAALLAGTGPSNDGVINSGSLMRDATTPTRWRVDCYGGATAFCAVDGTHPNIGVGIPYMVANLTIPTLN